MWRLNSCIPQPDSFDENRETSTPRNVSRFPNVWFCFQSVSPVVIRSQIRWWLSPGSQDHDHGLWSLRSSWHPPDPDIVMSSSTCPHPVCTLSINTLLLTPPINTKCLLFTLLYYTPNLFTRYLFSEAFVLSKHQPIRSRCWLSLTNEWQGLDVIVTLHNIGSLTFSHSQTSDHQSLNKYKQFAGPGPIHFQFLFKLSLSVISPRHMVRKNSWINYSIV